jgi:diguanylate cyclase (GGDEF)-like protein/PAS domain S-box-containing protein
MAFRKNPIDRSELRQLASERLHKKGLVASSDFDLAQAQHIFEELEIHQIELELQNEYLSEARAKLELALSQSTELYDFSPVGNLLVDAEGSISKLNLSGAHLLGNERAKLMGSKMGLFLNEAERPVFNELLARSRATGEVVAGELSITHNGFSSHYVQLYVASIPNNLGWQIVLVDITERRNVEEQLRLSEERWKLALDAAGDGVWDWNFKTGKIVFSKRFAELHGYSESEFDQRKENWLDRIHPEDKPQVMAIAQDCMVGKAAVFFSEHRAQSKDGSWKWVLARGAVVARDDENKPLRMIGTHVDISSRKKTEVALKDAVNFQQAVFDSLSAQVLVLDCHGCVQQTNQAWRNYSVASGFNGGPDFKGESYLKVLERLTEKSKEVIAQAQAGMASVVGGEVDSFQLPEPFFTFADKRWFSMKITPVNDLEKRLVVSHEDVTSLKAAELASMSLANIDGLTGAKSRLNFLNQAEQELERSTRYELPLMVLMMDLDRFKKINDHYGHAAGDAVLKSFVRTVSDVLRESDLIGRLGGEEFAVLLPNTTLDGGRALAQRIIECVQSSPVEFEGKKITYTVSIGASCLSSQNCFAALLGLADTALYRAKKGGRNRLEVRVD